MNIIKTELPNTVLKVKADLNRLDSSNAATFKDELFRIIDNGNTKLILDLNDISFIDSSGIGSIVATYKKIKPLGNLIIITKSQSILTMLKLTRLDKVLTIVESDNIMDAINFFWVKNWKKKYFR